MQPKHFQKHIFNVGKLQSVSLRQLPITPSVNLKAFSKAQTVQYWDKAKRSLSQVFVIAGNISVDSYKERINLE